MEKPETDKNVEYNPKISHENKDLRKNLLEIAGYGGISATANIIKYKAGDTIPMALPAEGVSCERQTPWGAVNLGSKMYTRVSAGTIPMALPAEGVSCERQTPWGAINLGSKMYTCPEPDSTVSPPLIYIYINNNNNDNISSKSMNATVDATSLKCYSICGEVYPTPSRLQIFPL